MKTYILRDPKAVEPQMPAALTRTDPEIAATTAAIITPHLPLPKTGLVLFIGLDVHNDSIAVSQASSDSTAVRRYGIIGGSRRALVEAAWNYRAPARLSRGLQERQEGCPRASLMPLGRPWTSATLRRNR